MLTLLYSAALLVSALLLFSIQPMVTKMVLPLLGGSAAVWNTAQVFFQATLFSGYVYAHLLTRWLPRRAQVLVHLSFILLVIFTLPIVLSPDARPPATGTPIPWLLSLLVVVVGLPFLAISATAPLLQRWFALAQNRVGADPYFLYAASNFGGLLALLGYPVLLEPLFGLQAQGRFWAGGYIVLVVLIGASALHLFVRGADEGAVGRTESDEQSGPSWSLRLRWLMLAFVPSSLLLSVTLHINTDIAPSPVLWVVPLSLYLLSFIVVFARRRVLRHDWMVALQSVLIVTLTLFFSIDALFLDLAHHLAAFFVIAMVCHGSLANTRPNARFLTEFYMCLSFGGLMGGVFSGVIAPLSFNSLLEYPLVLALACVLRPATKTTRESRSRIWDLVLPLALGGFFLVQNFYQRGADFDVGEVGRLAILVLFGLALYSFRHRPVRFALGALCLLLPVEMMLTSQLLEQRRSFYGEHRVVTDGTYQFLLHGTTVHGIEHRAVARQREALAYYHQSGPLGQVFETFAGETDFERVGIIGLGAGTIACYRKSPSARYTFFEIDPTVVEIAANPEYFRFLSLCGDNVEVILGDGRRGLSVAEDRVFDLLVLDAFSSDAIPVHLLTREALALYVQKLSLDGLLLMHISNASLDLEPVVAALMEDAGLVGYIQHHVPSADSDPYWCNSTWVAVALDNHDNVIFSKDDRWRRMQPVSASQAWTDDYSKLVDAFVWSSMISFSRQDVVACNSNASKRE